MNYFHITRNNATDGQCGTCSNFVLCGCLLGVCSVNNYEEYMTEDECDCGKYNKGEPTYD